MAISNLELKTAIYNLLTSLGKRHITLNDYILALKLSGKNQDLAKLQIDITKQIDSNLTKKYLLNKQIEQTHAKYLILEADKESLNLQYLSVLQQQQRMDAAKNSAQVSIKNLDDNKKAITGLFNSDIKTINDSITKLNQELTALQNQIKDPNIAASAKTALKANANAKLITLDVEQGKLKIKTLDRDQRIDLLNLQIAQHTDRIKLLDPQITSQKIIVGEYSKKLVDKISEYNTLGTKEKGLIAELAAHEKNFSNLIIEKPQVAVDKLITIAELKQQQDLLIDRELDVNEERYFALEQLQSVTVSYVEVIVKNANATTLATYNSFLDNLTDKTKDLADIWQGNLAESVDYTQTIGLAQSKLTQEREKFNKYAEEKLADPDGKYSLAGIELEEAAILRDYFAYRYDGLTHAETVTKSIVELYKKQNQQAIDLSNKIKPYLDFAQYTNDLVKIDSLEQQIINIKNSLVDPKSTDFKKIEDFLIANGKTGSIQAKYDALIKPYNDILAAKTKLLSSPAYLNAPLTDSFNITSPFPNTGYAVGFNNYNYLSGDFNGDGKTDLIHFATNSYVHTWISNGNGTFDIKNPFTPWNGYAINGNNNYKYLSGDFNGDGKTDLIHLGSDYVHTWVSKGDGTFDVKSPFTPWNGYAIGSNNYNYQTGDFNGDGKTDLIHFVNNDAINVWFSKGDGTFEIKKQGGFTPWNGYAISGNNNYKYLSGDFNGDGKTDLVHLGSDYVHAWISKGDGTFDVKSPFTPWNGYAIGSNNYNYQTGDFNGDGKTDLIHFVNNDVINVWFSKGDGTFEIKKQGGFTPQSGYAVGSNNYNYRVGDFNGDGKTDLIHFVNDKYINKWTSKGDGTFEVTTPIANTGYGVGSNNYNYQTGDFNGDGKTDLVHFVNNNYVHILNSLGDSQTAQKNKIDAEIAIIKQKVSNDIQGLINPIIESLNPIINEKQKQVLANLSNYLSKDVKDFATSNNQNTFGQYLNNRLDLINQNSDRDLTNLNDRVSQLSTSNKADNLLGLSTIVFNPNTQHYYALTSLTTWHNAQAEAVKFGGHLITVNDANEQNFILQSFGNSQDLWIGLNDERQEGKFEWVNGEQVSYTNFNTGEPNNWLNEDYVHLHRAAYGTTDGKWNDLDERYYTGDANGNYIYDGLHTRGIIEIDSKAIIDDLIAKNREELQRQKTSGLINLKLEITQLLQSPDRAKFLQEYQGLPSADKELKLKQLREKYFPGSTDNVDLTTLQQQIFTQQTNYQTEQTKLNQEIQAKQASANADLAQAQWYEDQAAIHWTASHKQGAVWIEKRQYKQRKVFGKKTKTLEVRHVDTNWIIWDAYTKQAAIERQQAKDALAGVKSSTEAKTIVTTLLDSWITAATTAQNAGSTKTEFQAYITKLETEKSTWIKNNKAATLEKILPTISAEVAKAKTALDNANQTLTTEQAEYELSKKNYQTALDGVLDKKSLVDLQTQQVKLQLAAAEEWVKQELKGLDEEIQLTQKNKADLTNQIGTITEQLKTATLQKAELTSKKLLLEQSVQLITYQEAVLTKEKNNFTQKQSLITAQRNVINSEEKLLDKYLESPDNDYSNLEKELASARAALIEVQKLNQQALDSSEKISDSLAKIQKDLLLQYDTKLAAVKDQQKIFLDLLTATKLQSNYTAEEAAQQGVLNKIQTDIITRLIEADRSGSAEAKELLKQASANNWATVAEIYARDYSDFATDNGSKCSKGIAKLEDKILADKYIQEAKKYREAESNAKTQAANLKSLREKNQIQIDTLKGQELQAQRDLDVWTNKVAVTQLEIDKKQQELILAEVRIDVLGSMIEWTNQATNQLLTIEKLNYEQALLVQDLVAKRQLGIDQTVIARLEREQLQLGTQRNEILSQIEQINQVQTETALQSAINELRADLGLGGISLVPNQTNQNKSLIELQQQLGELQKDPKLPTNIQDLLTQTKLDIGEVLKGKELATIQDNLLKATDALIKQNDQYQSQLAVFEQDEQNYRDIYTLVQSDLQAATAKLLTEIQKTGQLKTEESLLNAKNLENLYKLANGASAVAIATAIGKQPRELIEQIIEARIEDRIVRKKAFLNEVFGVFGTALKLVGTILSFTPLAPVGIGLTAAGGAIGAVQAAYNGNWASAIYQLATTILVAGTSYVSASLSSAKTALATAKDLKNAADITKYTNIVDSLGKTKLTFDVLNTSVSTIYGTYQAAKEGNGTLAFLTAINGVAKGFSTVAAATPLNANLQSLSKILNVANNLSRATAGAIGAFESGDIFGGLTYIGQAAGTISQNFAQDLEKDNFKALRVILNVTEKAPTAYKAIQAFKEGDWINGFAKTFETIKPLGEFFKSPDNATNGQAPVPGNPTDIVSKVKGWVDKIETNLKNIDQIIKNATGLDHQGWINVAKTSVKVIALLKQDNVKGWIKGINEILDIWQKEGDSATLAKIGKVLDTADKLVDSYETGTLNGWLNGINDTLGIWQDDIRGFVETRRQKAVADRNFDTTKSLDDIKDPILKTTIENNRKFLTDINKLKALNLSPADPNLKDHFSFNPKTNQMYFLADTIAPNATNKFAAGKQVKLYIPITDLNNPPNIEKIKAQIKNGSPEIKLIVHGFQNSINSHWQEDLAEIEIKKNSNAIVIIADWGDMAGKSLLDYKYAAKNTNLVGDAIAAKLVTLGVKDSSKITIIGHSLGAQVAANISESLQLAELGKVAKIIALDPARPEFENSVFWWGDNSKNLDNRLDGLDVGC